MNHCEKIYDMRVVRMSPTVVGASGTLETVSNNVSLISNFSLVSMISSEYCQSGFILFSLIDTY
jgi:hypothetical protein